MYKTIILLLFIPFVVQAQESLLLDFINKADPNGVYGEMILNLRIQEPRTQNPERFSNVYLDFSTGVFSMDRNREDKIATYSIDAAGIPEVALDGCKKISDEDKSTYILDKDRNTGYRGYYEYLYGLPMILQDQNKFVFLSLSETTIDGQKAYEFTLKLSKAVFSDIWKVSFGENGKIKKLDFYDPERPKEGEYILFDGNFKNGSVILPRFRHWHDKKDGSYLGSDIIVSNLMAEKM